MRPVDVYQSARMNFYASILVTSAALLSSLAVTTSPAFFFLAITDLVSRQSVFLSRDLSPYAVQRHPSIASGNGKLKSRNIFGDTDGRCQSNRPLITVSRDGISVHHRNGSGAFLHPPMTAAFPVTFTRPGQVSFFFRKWRKINQDPMSLSGMSATAPCICAP